MSSRPRVTVVAFTYNHSKFIVEALESVLAQRTSFEFEVVVLDDCSTDGTTGIVLDYAHRFPERIRTVVPEKNRNDNTLFMETWKNSRADYVALLESDDCWIDPAKLQSQVDFLDSNRKCSLSFHNVEIWSETKGRVLRNSNPPNQPSLLTIQDLLSSTSLIRTCSAMIRREALVELPDWYANEVGGDTALFLLAMRQGPAGYVDRVMARYREHPGGVWSPLRYQEQLEFVIRLLDRLLGRLGEGYDEEIRLAMIKRCYELIAERERGPGPLVPSPEPIREIEERLLPRARETALRVTQVVAGWRPEDLWGASIDMPKSGTLVDVRSVDLAGWALSKLSSVESVELIRDGRSISQTTARLPRPDVAAVFPGVPGSASTGFQTSVRIDKQTRCVRIQAVTEEGERLPIGEIRFGGNLVASS